MNNPKFQNFSNPEWLKENSFSALSEIASLLNNNEDEGRELLIRILEHQHIFNGFHPVLTSLIQKSGLFPYLTKLEELSTNDLLNLEFHTPDGLDDIILHSMQGKVYRALMDGANVILSAPTSFGKSLLIDAMIASRRFTCAVVIVPTIALIDETRRRLSKRFNTEFKIITHPSQSPAEKNIYVLTQERFVEFDELPTPDFFVVDEFYKLSPTSEDERTFVLNHAFYKLLKSGAQFFMIGPNVQDITIDKTQLNFRYFGTDFSTVASEIKLIEQGKAEERALDICRTLKEPTLVFCKSASSAYKLADFLRNEGIRSPNNSVRGVAKWLRDNYHPNWNLADFIEDGFAIHHGALPRSVAYHILRKFNEGVIPFLLCTSTIIEGVNTAAKNIIIYDNKIATKKFDQFTFNNIKGRAGRMFRHFVGHIYVLNQEPQQELPFVDIPSITQPENAPESLLIQIDNYELSEHSKEKLRYLHAQDILPIEVIKQNVGLSPDSQLQLGKEITNNMEKYHPFLNWNRFPNSDQLSNVCTLIFKYLMGEMGKDGIFSAKQLHFKMSQFSQVQKMSSLIATEIKDNSKINTPSEAVETVLMFLRRWCEYNFPRYLKALDNIQRSVFEQFDRKPGNYEIYGTAVKQLFMPLSATLLEEYGLPYQLTLKFESQESLGKDVDEILGKISKIDPSRLELSPFEEDMFKDTIENL